MFDGNTFLPVTGTPMRKMACMMMPLADADPVPLAVAILKANSLTRSIRFPLQVNRDPAWLRYVVRRQLRFHRQRGAGKGNLHREHPHVPRVGGASLGAEATVNADVLVLDHYAARLLEAA